MMNLLYHSSMPKIDLHGENRDTARILVKEFIKDNYQAGFFELAIIHGIGQGILKKEVHNVLKHTKEVEWFGLDIFNSGCTLVKLCRSVDKKGHLVYNTHHNSKGDRL